MRTRQVSPGSTMPNYPWLFKNTTDLAALGLPDETSYVARYCRLTGRESIADWPFFMAFSMFRSAKKISLPAASSWGKWPRVLITFRICMCRLSMALVV